MPRNRHRLPIDLGRLRAPRTLGLTVAWRTGRPARRRRHPHVRKRRRSPARRDHNDTRAVRESDLRAYGPDMQLETEEVLYVNDADLVSESRLGEVLFPDQPLQTISARTLPERPLVLYAVTFRGAGEPVAFVRKTNPRKSAGAGRMLALLGNTLTDADKPVFTLDPSFDLIVAPGGVIALEQGVFELLFKETDAVLEAIPGWVDAIAAHLPLAGDGAALLGEKAMTSSRLRRRLRAINERGHLAYVDIARVRALLRALGLKDADFVDGDELVVDEADPMTLLELLNEDLFTGGPRAGVRDSPLPPAERLA
jgi:hypothetical protein